MKRRLLVTLGMTLLFAATTAASPPAPAQTLQSANDVLDELMAIPGKGIPASILANAHGVAIIPRVLKAGFILGGRVGHGLVLTRDRNGVWSGPTFAYLGGASLGFQAGVESADVVLVFRTPESLKRILHGKGKLTLGADAAIAAGPIGRQVEAGTDARLRAEILSYSRSRGLFAGVALDGAIIKFDRGANAAYSREQRPEVLQQTVNLLTRLTALSKPPVVLPPAPVIIQPPVIVSPTAPPPLAPPMPAPPSPQPSPAPFPPGRP